MDVEAIRERQEADSRWWQQRAAELHRWFQGGAEPSAETLAWARTEISDTYNVRVLMQTMAQLGHIPPPTEESIVKAERDLAALGLEPWASMQHDGQESGE